MDSVDYNDRHRHATMTRRLTFSQLKFSHKTSNKAYSKLRVQNKRRGSETDVRRVLINAGVLKQYRVPEGDAIAQWSACWISDPIGHGFRPRWLRAVATRSNNGPVALCTLGLGLLNPPPLNGR